MDLIPNFFGNRRGDSSDPFSMDPFVMLPFSSFIPNLPSFVPNLPSFAPNLTRVVRPAMTVSNARLDWKEWPLFHVFKVDVPDLDKEELKVEVEEGNVLQISGERIKEPDEKTGGKFVHRFWMPENAKLYEAKASVDFGVLTVKVPKEVKSVRSLVK